MHVLSRRRLRHGSTTFALVAVLALPAAAQGRSCERSDVPPVAGALDDAVSAVVCEINNERRSRGLRPLDERPRLSRAGARYAAAMVDRRFFAHVSPGG